MQKISSLRSEGGRLAVIFIHGSFHGRSLGCFSMVPSSSFAFLGRQASPCGGWHGGNMLTPAIANEL
jgi:4-aminobutyrate aminotransferase-like enzyme